MTAEAEYAVNEASQFGPTTARLPSARPTTANSTDASPLVRYIPKLLEAIEQERTYVEDDFQARVCLGWIHWHIGEPGLAVSRLPKSIEQEFAQLDATNKDSAGWTKVCALKASYIKASAQVQTGATADALVTYDTALPIFATISTAPNPGKQLKIWAELYLTGFCMLSGEAIRSKGSSIQNTETLTAFRSWGKFWESQGATIIGGRVTGGEVSRREVWKEYYIVVSQLLREEASFPLTSLIPANSSTSTRVQQRTNLKLVEAKYETILLAEIQFPKAEAFSEEVESFVELVMENWRILCGTSWKEQDLSEGGTEAVSKGVLDILYRAATKTFHSTPILRHLFTVHLAVADFDLAFKAFDTYMEIVKRGKSRLENTGDIEESLDNDETVLKTASECIKAMCRYGTSTAAQKAKDLGSFFEIWLDKYQTIDQVNGSDRPSEKDVSTYSIGAVAPSVIAVTWRSVGIAYANWARYTYEASERSEIQLHAIQCFRKALHPKYESNSDVETLFALGTILAERRELGAAIEVVKSALLPPKSSNGNGMVPIPANFSRERSLIPLWHLLALLLSARQEFLTAARACEGAFEQFQDPKNLFGDAELGSPYRSDHLKTNEKSSSRGLGVVDEMDDFEKENVLGVKMTQLALIEVLEGPEVAVNASDELLSLYGRLFGESKKDSLTALPSRMLTQVPPKSSSGTIRSIKGSIFRRSSRSQQKLRTASRERSALTLQTYPSQTLVSSPAPVIEVTNENGNVAKQHLHLTKQSPAEKQKRYSSLSQKTPKSGRNRSISGSLRGRKAATTLDGEQNITLPNLSQDQGQWNSDGSKGQQIPLRQKSLNGGNSERPETKDSQLSHLSPYSLATTPITRFPKTQERRRRIAILVNVWLFVSVFYRRAGMFEDAKGAIQEAHKLTQDLEVDVANDASCDISISDAGWAGGKNVVELCADVSAEVSISSSFLQHFLIIYSVATLPLPSHYLMLRLNILRPL